MTPVAQPERAAWVSAVAMGIESETQLKLLWWDAASSTWFPVFNPELDRAEQVLIVSQALMGEFALVAEEVQASHKVRIPLVMK